MEHRFICVISAVIFVGCNTNESNLSSSNVTTLEAAEVSADKEITKQLKQALIEDNTIPHHISNGIKITTVNGTVTLEGEVPSNQIKNSIEATAKQISGVTQVNNHLVVIGSKVK